MLCGERGTGGGAEGQARVQVAYTQHGRKGEKGVTIAPLFIGKIQGKDRMHGRNADEDETSKKYRQ